MNTTQVAPAQSGSQPIVIEEFQRLSSQTTSLRDQVGKLSNEGVAVDLLADPLANLESAVAAFQAASSALKESAADREIHTRNPSAGDIISCPGFAVGFRYSRDDTSKVRIATPDEMRRQLNSTLCSDACDESRGSAKFVVLPGSLDGISARRLAANGTDDGSGEVIFVASGNANREMQIRLHESVRLKVNVEN